MEMHDYEKFAKAYGDLGVKDSFYLAYRDIPRLAKKYVKGKKALDFGCGAGRSTRFLKKLNFNVIGVDISKEMIKQAKQKDIEGQYHLIKNTGLPFEDSSFDFIFSSIAFLEISTKQEILNILKELKRVLKKEGILIIITGTPEAYENNWASFICDFTENKNLKSGDKAKFIVRGTNITMYDYVWFDKDYKEAFNKIGFQLLETQKPMPTGKEPYQWYAEKEKPLWIIYILKNKITT